MPTNDERRKVAYKIRRIPKTGKAVAFIVLAHQLGLEFHPDFAYGTVCTPESVMRLADLIEPAPERTCRMIDNGAELCCSECDCRHSYDDEPRFCMGCGARVAS
jgi:hypothetical protein